MVVFRWFSTGFHLRNNYLKRRARHFGLKRWRDELTNSWTTPKQLKRLFLQLSIHTLARGYGIRER